MKSNSKNRFEEKVKKYDDYIFISAQPDTDYFLWQLEIQINCMSRLGVKKENIHILIGYEKRKGLNKNFEKFIDNNSKAQVFVYEDLRTRKQYTPSLRPNIIGQHFDKFENLQIRAFLYIDSDIIFRELPNLDLDSEVWYCSDARSYIGAEYLMSQDKNILHGLCKIAGISVDVAISNDRNSGGAQFLLKNIDADFWRQVEEISENMYKYLIRSQRNLDVLIANKALSNTELPFIQAWCADMWALLYLGLKKGKSIEITAELDFCWPTDPIQKWSDVKILHNAGVLSSQQPYFFCKNTFRHVVPYYANLTQVSPEFCSIKYVEELQDFASKIIKTDLNSATFVFIVKIDSEDRQENLDIVLRHISRYFYTNLLILEIDSISKLDTSRLPYFVKHEFIKCKVGEENISSIINNALRKCESPAVIIHSPDAIVEPSSLIEAVFLIKNKKAVLAYPYDGTYINIDRSKLNQFYLDPSIEVINHFDKLKPTALKKEYRGTYLVDREKYLSLGGENENIKGWISEPREKVKRLEILGYRCLRTKGYLYHINHYKGTSARHGTMVNTSKLELLKICSMNKQQLESYISNWN